MSAAASARAELVIFSDGRVVKATSTQVVGDQVEIGLPGGGSYRVDRTRIDRIVADEVAAAPMGPQQPGPAPVIVRPLSAAPPRAEIAPASPEAQAPNPNSRRKREDTHHGGKAKRGRSR